MSSAAAFEPEKYDSSIRKKEPEKINNILQEEK